MKKLRRFAEKFVGKSTKTGKKCQDRRIDFQ